MNNLFLPAHTTLTCTPTSSGHNCNNTMNTTLDRLAITSQRDFKVFFIKHLIMSTEEHQCLEQECEHTCVCSMHAISPEQNFWVQDVSRFTGLPMCTIPTWRCLSEGLCISLLRSITWLLWMCHSRAGRGWFLPGHGPLEWTEASFSCRDGREILHKDHAALEIKENTDLFFMLLSMVIFVFSTAKDFFFLCIYKQV